MPEFIKLTDVDGKAYYVRVGNIRRFRDSEVLADYCLYCKESAEQIAALLEEEK